MNTALQGNWTQYGLAREAAARAGGEKLTITHAAVGDGWGSLPQVSPAQTVLKNEVWRGLVNSVMVNPDDPTDVIIDIVIPNNVGGWWLREWGLFDDQGKLVAVGPHDEMHKPTIDSGQAAEFLERFHLPCADSGVITLSIASQALATQNYVQAKVKEHNDNPDVHASFLDKLLGLFVPKSRKITTAAPLTGGGQLTSDLALAVDLATAQTPGVVQSGRDIRIACTADVTLYVRPDGQDANDGLTDTPTGAFATPQAAWDCAARKYDLRGHLCTISVGNGTYPSLAGDLSEFVGARTYTPGVDGGCSIKIAGQGQATKIASIELGGPGGVMVDNLQAGTGTTYAVSAQRSAQVIVLDRIWIGACDYAFSVTYGGRIYFSGATGVPQVIVTGDVSRCFLYAGGAQGLVLGSVKVTHSVPMTLTSSYGYAQANRCAVIYLTVSTFSGTVTGTRYKAVSGGVIDTSGGGANYFPGTIAGTVTAGGIYV